MLLSRHARQARRKEKPGRENNSTSIRLKGEKGGVVVHAVDVFGDPRGVR